MYHLCWKDIEAMPYGELDELLWELPKMHRLMTQVEVVSRG